MEGADGQIVTVDMRKFICIGGERKGGWRQHQVGHQQINSSLMVLAEPERIRTASGLQDVKPFLRKHLRDNSQHRRFVVDDKYRLLR